jgi:D,D-heptose 1,7-bisphosphate phosphatase
MQAVVLVGGLGTRLGGLTRETPKPLMQIGDKPFLEYLIANLARFGFDKILLLAGFQAVKIIENFRENHRFPGLKIDYSIEEAPAGTAGALQIAQEQLEDQFLLINGDTFFDFNYLDLLVRDPGDKWALKMALREIGNSDRYGSVQMLGNRIAGFVEKGEPVEPTIINCGAYHMKKSILNYIKKLPCSLENDILPTLVNEGLLYGYTYEGYFIDIGIPTDLVKAQNEMPNMQKPAVFFDRDGVLNKDLGYTHLPEQVEWNPGAIEAVKHANDNGYFVVVVTNQAGIARGFYDEQAVEKLHEWMNQQLSYFGAHVDAFYYCPHHPEAGIGKYLKVCDCRKPGPGMLLQAIIDLGVNVSDSVLIGDKDSDLLAAENCHIRGYRYKDGNLLDLLNTII